MLVTREVEDGPGERDPWNVILIVLGILAAIALVVMAVALAAWYSLRA